jgi:hypothetical protein
MVCAVLGLYILSYIFYMILNKYRHFKYKMVGHELGLNNACAM